jgi:hypothetical protein
MKEAGAAQHDERTAGANSWAGYADDGDEFFLAYLSLTEHEHSINVTAPWMFLGAHTLELYLKAAQVRADPTISDADLRKHLLAARWNACREMAGCPLPFEMQPLDPTKTTFNWHDWGEALPLDERLHYATYGSIHRAVQHTVDLKYLSAGGKSIPDGPIAYTWMVPDDTMIRLLQGLRSWLGHRQRVSEILDGRVARFIGPV